MESKLQNSELNSDVSKIHSKVIKTFLELEKFREIYNSKNGVEVDLSYLLNASMVKVFINEKEDWVAGYVVNSNKPMRYLNMFEPNIKKTILRDCNLEENDLTEISCIMVERSLTKQNPKLRLEVYYQSVLDAAACQKPYIIGGSKVFTTWKTFEIILTKSIYFGYIPLNGVFELAKLVYNTTGEALERLNDFKTNNG